MFGGVTLVHVALGDVHREALIVVEELCGGDFQQRVVEGRLAFGVGAAGLQHQSGVRLLRFKHVEEVVVSGTNPGIHLRLERIRRLLVFNGGLGRFVDVRQVVVDDLYLCQPVGHINLKRTSGLFDGSRIVWLGASGIQPSAATCKRPVLQSRANISERFPDLRAHVACLDKTLGRKRVDCLGDRPAGLIQLREIVIERMKPFVGQRAGASGLGDVDDHFIRRVGSHRLAATASRAKRKGQRTVERKRLGRHAERFRQIKQRIVGLVDVGLSPVGFNVVPKLHATEPKRVAEYLRRDIALATGLAHARCVGRFSESRLRPHFLPERFERGTVILEVIARLLDGLEAGLHPHDTIRALLADKDVFGGILVDVERGFARHRTSLRIRRNLRLQLRADHAHNFRIRLSGILV